MPEEALLKNSWREDKASKFVEHSNSKWTYSFASHPCCGYWAFNII